MSDTTDSTGDHYDSTTDGSVAGLSVNDAATRLGITPDAVRARIRRGTLHAEKHENVWTVYLSETTRHDTDRRAAEPVTRQTATNPSVVQGPNLGPLVDLLADAMQRNADVMKQNADLAATAAMWQTRAAHLEERLEALAPGPIVTAERRGDRILDRDDVAHQWIPTIASAVAIIISAVALLQWFAGQIRTREVVPILLSGLVIVVMGTLMWRFTRWHYRWAMERAERLFPQNRHAMRRMRQGYWVFVALSGAGGIALVIWGPQPFG